MKSGSETPRRAIKREIILLYGITLVVTGGLAWLQGSVGWIRSYLLVMAAAVFLYLPIEYLQRKGIDPASFGIKLGSLKKALINVAIVSAVVFPPYLIGFHGWQTVQLKKSLNIEEARFDRWPIELLDAPRQTTPNEGEVRIFSAREQVWLQWRLPAGQRFEAKITGDGPIDTAGPYGAAQVGPHGIDVASGSRGQVGIKAPGDWIAFELEAGGDRLPSNRLKLGASLIEADANPVRFERSLFWLINLILVQLLLVALPEEVFYRGYLQTRLDQIFPSTRRILGVEVSVMSLMVTSALFAFGHFVTVPSIQRLAVFFPSLLFGWMRKATGSVTAAVLFHAVCNVFVEIASRFYG